VDAAIARAEQMIAQGAEVIDVGGESTRPGADPTPEPEELARVIPLIEALRPRTDVTLSIDTRRPAVARAAVAAGADMWNDVSGLTHAPDSPLVAAELGCEIVIMHMQGKPATMQRAPTYADVVGEVHGWLAGRAAAAMAAGVARAKIWLDPGLGFGKTLAHNLALLAALEDLVTLGFPVLLGASRKGMIRAIDPSAGDPLDRLGGSLAVALEGYRSGCAMARVHDVRETVQAFRVAEAIDSARPRHD
jgi:dihydropteroate synthase